MRTIKFKAKTLEDGEWIVGVCKWKNYPVLRRRL